MTERVASAENVDDHVALQLGRAILEAQRLADGILEDARRRANEMVNRTPELAATDTALGIEQVDLRDGNRLVGGTHKAAELSRELRELEQTMASSVAQLLDLLGRQESGGSAGSPRTSRPIQEESASAPVQMPEDRLDAGSVDVRESSLAAFFGPVDTATPVAEPPDTAVPGPDLTDSAVVVTQVDLADPVSLAGSVDLADPVAVSEGDLADTLITTAAPQTLEMQIEVKNDDFDGEDAELPWGTPWYTAESALGSAGTLPRRRLPAAWASSLVTAAIASAVLVLSLVFLQGL